MASPYPYSAEGKLAIFSNKDVLISGRKFIAISLAVIMAYEVVGLPLAEANQHAQVWEQRQRAAADHQKQLASLPATLNPQRLLDQLPSIKAALPTAKWTN